MSSNKYFFYRHPKLTIVIFSGIILLAFICAIVFLLNLKIFTYDKQTKYSLYQHTINQIRCAGERHIRLRELKPNSNYIRIPKENFEHLENKRYQLKTDANGIITPSFVNTDPDWQIFFLGGSTTECELVDAQYRFPYLVGRMLQQDLGLKINSDNAAKSGNNSLHSINILFNKLIPLKPQMVVMMHNINDLSTLFYHGTYWNQNKTIAPIVCDYRNNGNYRKQDQWSIEQDFVNKLLNNKIEQQKILQKFRDNLIMFIAIAKAKHIVPVLMTQFNMIEQNQKFTTGRGIEIDKLYQKLYTQFNQEIRNVAKQEQVFLIELANTIPREEKYLYDKVHLNQQGSILVASQIVKQLTPYLQKLITTK